MDADGRELVDPKGKPITYTTNKDGSLSFSKNATESMRTFVTELSKNEVGQQTLTGLVNSPTRVSVDITTERATGKDANGKIRGLEGQTDGQGKVIDPKTGREVYKTAEITIYAGEHAAEAQEGSGQYSKSTLGKFINGVGVHEATHALDDVEHNKQVANTPGLDAKEVQKEQDRTHEDKPNQQEQLANSNYAQ